MRQSVSRSFLATPVAILILLLSACAITPFESVEVSGNPAVLSLTESARQDIEVGNYVTAAASLERALRIEPRNARLWYELARVRMDQKMYRQVESLALRANSFAADNNQLRQASWRLIGESREQRGDVAGAQQAYERAQTY
jgi:cytochrome c-type biogenesis protein CcmH/NrfG